MNDELSLLIDELCQQEKICYTENRLAILKELSIFNSEIPVITVTGTNGKGSTVASLKSIYQQAGYRVGVYTSPHLISYKERITINSEQISDEDFIFELQYFKHKSSEISFKPSWFEYLTLSALSYFSKKNVDLILLEVGMGGRLDATNIVDANLVIITNVDLDHQDYLGQTIEDIALEKAGLFRPQQLAIFADIDCPHSILKQAKKLNVQLHRLNESFQYKEDLNGWTYSDKAYQKTFQLKPQILISAFATAMYACRLLSSLLPISDIIFEQAMNVVFLPGRFQKIATTIPIILDVAHNPHAVKLLCQRLENFPGKIHAIFSILKDKDAISIVNEFNKLSPLWYNCLTDTLRSHTKDSFQAIFNLLGIESNNFEKPEHALEKARSLAKQDDMIVVFGSFTLIGPIMLYLMKEGIDVFCLNR